VPLLNGQGICEYSLGTSGVADRMTREKISHAIPLMLKAAREISAGTGLEL